MASPYTSSWLVSSRPAQTRARSGHYGLPQQARMSSGVGQAGAAPAAPVPSRADANRGRWYVRRRVMEQILPALGMSVLVFVSTNVDDILLLAAFFADPGFTRGQVVAGQFLGMAVLVMASVACALLAVRVPDGWIGLLGLAPLALGLRGLWALWRGSRAREAGAVDEAEEAGDAHEVRGGASRFKAIAVAAVTLANGGDNLGVYIPLFSSSPAHIPLHAAVFALMTGAWCALGHRLVNHPILGSRIRRGGRAALPFVLIGLGLWILSDAIVLVRAG
ncbi:cadmium resistance transporter [Sorangium sp. So ce1000]|uniref:cadmium resistance transporter n=1 Tax=Sorangium sp. So ce1000 TaxID=3133325 RepID=UPI003F64445F